MGVHPGEKRGAKGTDLGGQFIGPKSVAKFLMKLLKPEGHDHGPGKPAADERRTMGRFVTGGGSVISARLPERKAGIDDRVVDTNNPRRLGTVASVLPDGSHRVHWDDGTHSVQPAGTVTTPLRESGRSFDAHTSPAVAKMTAKPPRPLTPTEHLAEQVAAGHVSSSDAADLMRLSGRSHVDPPQATGSAATPKRDFTVGSTSGVDEHLAATYASTRAPSKAVAKVTAAKKVAPAKAAKKAVPKAETGVHPAVEKMLRLGTPPRMTERGPLPGERPKVGAPKQAAPDIKQVEMHLASVGVNSPTSTAEDEARKYIDDLKLSAAQMKQLGKDLGVPSLSTASKAQLRDDIVKVHVTGRVRTRAIGEMYRQPDAASHPDGLDSMEPTALGKYAREFDVQTSGKTPDEIKAALRAQGVGSPDVEAAKRAAGDAAAPKVPSGPTLAHSEAQVVERIHAATRKLERRPGGWVSLTNLRAETPDIPREQLDRTLIRMSLGGNGMFVVPESNQKMLRQADRDAALSVGNQDRHVMRIEPHVSPEHSVRGIAESDREDAEYRARVAREEADRLGRTAAPSRAVAKVTAARKAAPAARAPKPLPRGQHDALRTMDAGGGSAPAALLTPSVSKALERDGLIRRDGNSVSLTDQGRSALATRAPAARPDFAAKAAEVRRVGGDQQAIQEQLSGLSASDLHSLAYELNLSVPSAARSAPARRLFIAQSLSQHFRRTSGGL